jgi:4-amino-4-deoxy-L-arabinose transferase-like glycosyltransferase
VAVATRRTAAPPPPAAEEYQPAPSTHGVPGGARFTRNPALALSVILAVAVVLRLIQLGHDSLWIDEVTVAWRSHGHRLLGAVRDAGALETPASYAVTAPFLHLPLGVETAVRLPMAIFGAVEVLAIYLLGRELSRRAAVGLIAALLLAVAPFAVRYSQEARQYVMFSALHLLSWWLLLRALQRRRTRDWVALGACNGALLLTHQYAPLVIAMQLFVLAVIVLREWGSRPRSARSVIRGSGISLVTAAGIKAPWLLYYLPTAISEGTALSPDYALGKGVPLVPDLAKRGAQFLFGNNTRLTVLAVVLAGVCLAAPLITRGRDRKVVLAIALYTVTFAVFLVAIARAIGTYYAFRRVEFLLPLLFLLVAFAVVGAYDRLQRVKAARRVAGPVLALGLAVVVGMSVARTLDYYGAEKTNLRAIGELSRSAPDSTLVATFCTTPRGWEPRLAEYVATHGFHRPLVFIDWSGRPPALPPGTTRVLLFSGVPVTAPGWETRPLNRLDRLQVVAADGNFGQPTHPLYVATGTLAGNDEWSSVVASLRTNRSCTTEAP